MLSPFDINAKSNEIVEKAYKMEKYKQTLEAGMKNLDKDYEKYRRKPEEHPMYKDEWIEFWGRRYKELKKEGRVNANDYNYKPEWIKYWTKRVEEMFKEKREALKEEIRVKFNLPKNFEVIEKPAKKRVRVPSECEEISSDDSSSHSFRSPARRRRSSSYSSQVSSNYYDTRPTYRAKAIDHRPKFEHYMNEPVTFVNVCRLLSALESELGCLSQKVLELLSKALAIEKLKPNSCDQVLMTNETAVFLETVKEKMKGLLMVEVFPPNKEYAVKKCIQNIARLIHQTPIREEETAVETLEISREDEEKMKLAGKITDMLRALGKEDYTANELEVLVETFLEHSNESKNEPKVEAKESNTKADQKSNLDSLSDSDLKILLSNFSDLEKDEQDQLIGYLSVIEKTNPSKVDELRNYVKVDKKPEGIIEVIDLDNDPDDYNIEEVITSVVGQTHVRQEEAPGTSLTDNLLSLNNHRSIPFL